MSGLLTELLFISSKDTGVSPLTVFHRRASASSGSPQQTAFDSLDGKEQH